MNPTTWYELPDDTKETLRNAFGSDPELDPGIPEGIVEERLKGQSPKRTELQEFLDRFLRMS